LTDPANIRIDVVYRLFVPRALALSASAETAKARQVFLTLNKLLIAESPSDNAVAADMRSLTALTDAAGEGLRVHPTAVTLTME